MKVNVREVCKSSQFSNITPPNPLRALLLTLSNPLKKQRIVRSVKVVEDLGFSIDYFLTTKTIEELKADSSSIAERAIPIDAGYTRTIKARISRNFLSTISLLLNRRSKVRHRIVLSLQVPEYNRILTESKLTGGIDYSLILVEEIQLLPFALELKSRSSISTRLVVELRDYYWHDRTAFSIRESLSKKMVWLFFRAKAQSNRRHLYRRYLPFADQVFTVSNSLSREIKETTGVASRVVYSLPQFAEAPVVSRSSKDSLQFIYHGLALRKRKHENLIKAFQAASAEIHLVLYLVAGDELYIEELRALTCGRVEIREPVPYAKLVEEAARYDVGLAYFPDDDSTMRGALPNKFFEYFQSRIPVLASPSEDMVKILNEWGTGWATKDWSFGSLVECLESITPEMVTEAQQNCERAARHFCFETNRSQLEQVLLGSELPQGKGSREKLV